MTITVIKSPWPADYEDGNVSPPWSYSPNAFKDWVWEVLLDMGKAGPYPETVTAAIDVAEGARYTIEVQS